MRSIIMAVSAILFNFSAYASADADIPKIISESKQPELYCMAQNIFFEAGTESYMGKVAVALVTMNRVKDARYPNTVCEVVKQGPTRESWKTKQTPDPNDAEFYPIKNMCQFSWYCDGKDDVPGNGVGWRTSQEIAILVVQLGQWRGLMEGATHYHATYVDPSWNKTKTLVGQVDRHIFYRWD